MISPEVLRRYPFFSFMNHHQLKEVAMITEEVDVAEGDTLFNIGAPADTLFFLMKGCLHLHYIVIDEHEPDLRKDFMVGAINSGDLVGISAVVEPHSLTATGLAVEPCHLLAIDAPALRKMADEDHDLGCGLMNAVAKVAKERLHDTRTLLAAASAPI